LITTSKSEKDRAIKYNGYPGSGFVKRKPGYIFPIIVTIFSIGWFCLPLLPVLVRAVVPFPKLEETSYLEGTFEYEGQLGRTTIPSYYVVNAQGRHEYKCGYFGSRHSCYTKPSELKGLPIKVWVSFWYGKVQYEITPTPGKRYGLDHLSFSYDDSVNLLSNESYQRGHRFSPIGPAIMILFLLWLIYKERERRQMLRDESSAE
jgi:hypothetical protein